MFAHIVADAKKIAHQARHLSKTKDAHRWILQLARPLADVADLVNENITALKKHSEKLERETSKLTREMLRVPKICLQVNELKQPITVCTSAQCCEFYSENNKKQHYYKQKCHDPCFMNNIPGDIIGSPELMYCAAMNAQYYCKKCSCHFSKHMHVLYLTRKIEERSSEPSETTSAALLLEQLRRKKLEYEAEAREIVKIMAKFSRFSQQHGFTSDGDSYERYLLYLIAREVKYGPDADQSLIKHYKEMLKDYRDEKGKLESSLSAEEIFVSVDKLFKLGNIGEQLKDLHEVQLKCTSWSENKSSGSSSQKVARKVTLVTP